MQKILQIILLQFSQSPANNTILPSHKKYVYLHIYTQQYKTIQKLNLVQKAQYLSQSLAYTCWYYANFMCFLLKNTY